MARVLVTGSADGLGRAAADALLDDGHDVVVHARSQARVRDMSDLCERGAVAIAADLSRRYEVDDLIDRLRDLEPLDAVIHNAAIMEGEALLPVNVVAPYLVSAAVGPAARHVYLSSSMHRSGRAVLTGADWSGSMETRSYSDSKLYVTTLMAALARFWPQSVVHAVDPGWVPTRMGGADAPDDLALGHVTQVWLATTTAPEALDSGGYWHHQRRARPHRAVGDVEFQQQLVAALERQTGIELPHG